jgi:hypothetical protein
VLCKAAWRSRAYGGGQAIVLVRSGRTVAARIGVADIAVVVLAVGEAVKNVSFVSDFWTAVREISTAGRFDGEYRPNFRCLDAHCAGNGGQAIA